MPLSESGANYRIYVLINGFSGNNSEFMSIHGIGQIEAKAFIKRTECL